MKLLIFTILSFVLLSCTCNKVNNFAVQNQHEQIGDGYSIFKNEIYYKRPVPNYSSYLPQPVKTEANFITFNNLGYRYANDKYNIFYRGEVISNVVKKSFLVFEIEDVFPIYINEILKPRIENQTKQDLMQNGVTAAASSLKNLIINNEIPEVEFYAKDNNHVFYGKKIISNADPITFVLLSILFSKDNSTVYYKGEPIQRSDTKTFELICGNLARDNNHIYYGDKIISSKPEKFIMMSENYAKDDNSIWFFRNMLWERFDTLNVSSVDEFKVIENRYAKDSEQVYFHGTLIENANSDQFQVLSNIWSKDDKYIYCCSKRCKEADYSTFEVIDNYAKDKNRIYDKNYRIWE
jgi:DKNYY family